ncbi:MAG: hypothetical protein EWV92_21095 [Microcystis aeruginosa Ma_MB_S_20031200_S102]|uniref:Uncharacterized protein n=1 Tax=Microcystis aeruginosa Ma_MB_S_20031200_S102 TaxID=2486254 RepID=A0A552E950_MICAE|nr:MAG: hypothetical protein EWV79_15195 [Microcystis aeruginosa Ma_MB_S_20031200_S102D]TRU30984.1 MAG: hypothetical protein EWV92_21095 [Microcystis aeruginosa Ma_MB_S_20031200_S102]
MVIQLSVISYQLSVISYQETGDWFYLKFPTSPLPHFLIRPVCNYIFSLDLQGFQKLAEIKYPLEP